MYDSINNALKKFGYHADHGREDIDIPKYGACIFRTGFDERMMRSLYLYMMITPLWSDNFNFCYLRDDFEHCKKGEYIIWVKASLFRDIPGVVRTSLHERCNGFVAGYRLAIEPSILAQEEQNLKVIEEWNSSVENIVVEFYNASAKDYLIDVSLPNDKRFSAIWKRADKSVLSNVDAQIVLRDAGVTFAELPVQIVITKRYVRAIYDVRHLSLNLRMYMKAHPNDPSNKAYQDIVNILQSIIYNKGYR